MLANCVECKRDFNVPKLSQKRIADNRYEVTYDCPLCGHKYVVCFLNKELVALQRRIAHGEKHLLNEYKQKLDALNHRDVQT